jgi:AraC family transcriptional regulator
MEVLHEHTAAAGRNEPWPYYESWGKHVPVNLLSTSANRGWSGLSAQLCSVSKAVVPWWTPQSEIRICVDVRGNKSFIARRALGIESRIVVRRGTVWLSPPGLQEGSLDITEDMSGVLHIYLPLRHFSPGNLDINIDRSAVGVLVERSIAAGYSACWIISKRTLKAILPLISWHPLLA